MRASSWTTRNACDLYTVMLVQNWYESSETAHTLAESMYLPYQESLRREEGNSVWESAEKFAHAVRGSSVFRSDARVTSGERSRACWCRFGTAHGVSKENATILIQRTGQYVTMEMYLPLTMHVENHLIPAEDIN